MKSASILKLTWLLELSKPLYNLIYLLGTNTEATVTEHWRRKLHSMWGSLLNVKLHCAVAKLKGHMQGKALKSHNSTSLAYN